MFLTMFLELRDVSSDLSRSSNLRTSSRVDRRSSTEPELLSGYSGVEVIEFCSDNKLRTLRLGNARNERLISQGSLGWNSWGRFVSH